MKIITFILIFMLFLSPLHFSFGVIGLFGLLFVAIRTIGKTICNDGITSEPVDGTGALFKQVDATSIEIDNILLK